MNNSKIRVIAATPVHHGLHGDLTHDLISGISTSCLAGVLSTSGIRGNKQGLSLAIHTKTAFSPILARTHNKRMSASMQENLSG
ncbi:TVG1492173 [Thermoplasma volcanium GSS1]|uniref:TVG1492173 protein n=1 Tax=Thermoplasma volcanium (strain ATCC 51530 / DSM 4299 / JCM 9571 / NBRC 15438 / GSS1) TaxID=273116 RepID=Q978H2_THEVO|nr:hypothetical protein [Thermoplasma volcanium]BAB60585.1 TVG1492173 [Thermoplasma volcanium GSS1]